MAQRRLVVRSPDAFAKAGADAHMAFPWLGLRANVGPSETCDDSHMKRRSEGVYTRNSWVPELEPKGLCAKLKAAPNRCRVHFVRTELPHMYVSSTALSLLSSRLCWPSSSRQQRGSRNSCADVTDGRFAALWRRKWHSGITREQDGMRGCLVPVWTREYSYM